MQNVFLIRHAESVKNLRDEHGGKGDNLSEKGKKQSKEISIYLRSESLHSTNTIVYYHLKPQVQQTTQIICDLNNYISISNEKLTGLNLGVLSGLSRNEALKKYPKAALRLEKWRKRELTIDSLNIPAAEDTAEFHNRVNFFVNKSLVKNEKNNVVIIGTTSVMIMLVNIFLLGNNFNFKEYKNYQFDCGSITKFIFIEDNFSLKYINKTDYM